MPSGRPYPAEVRTRVVAEILAGESITAVAKRNKIPVATAKGWWAEDRPVEPTSVRTRERMVEQLYDTAYECFDGVRATAKLLQDPDWTRTQTASGLAELVAVLSDRSIRMLGGLRPAESEQRILTDGTVVHATPGSADQSV